MLDQEYLERRITEEMAAAAASGDPSAARAHLALGEAYRLRLGLHTMARRAA